MIAFFIAVVMLHADPKLVLAETRQAALERQAWLLAYEEKSSFFEAGQTAVYMARLVTVHLRADGPKTWMRTFHFGPKCQSEKECIIMDERLNTVIQANDRQTVLNEHSLRGVITTLKIPDDDARLNNGGFLEQCFLRWPGMETARDRPYTVMDKSGKRYAVKLGELWLADALETPGWAVSSITIDDVKPTWPAAGAVQGELFALRKKIEGGVDDEVIVAKEFNWLPVARTWRNAAGEVLSAWRFSDFGYEEGNRWFCRAVTHSRVGGAKMITLDQFKVGKQPANTFELDFPPGCVVEDRIAGTKHTISGSAGSARAYFFERIRNEFFPLSPHIGSSFPMNVPVFGLWLRPPHPAWAILPGLFVGIWLCRGQKRLKPSATPSEPTDRKVKNKET